MARLPTRSWPKLKAHRWRRKDSAHHRHIAPFANLLLAEAEYATGDSAAALATVDSVLKLIGESGVGRETADAYRLRGDLVAHLEPMQSEAVVHCYRTAVDVARKQGARALELRAALSFARFPQAASFAREAVDTLSAALEGCANSTALPVVNQARALLGALKGP